MAKAIVVPRFNDNDDVMLFVEWLVDPGQPVKAGEDLYLVETSKAAVEAQAEFDGYLHAVATSGEEVRVQETIGFLLANPEEDIPEIPEAAALSHSALPIKPRSTVESGEAAPAAPSVPETAAESIAREEPAAPTHPTAPPNGEVMISRKAAALAQRLGVDPARIPVRGMIRQQDVQAFHDRQLLADRADSSAGAEGDDGRLNPEFLAQIRAAPEAFAALPSAFKLWLYRQNGALIGERATLAVGALIDAEQVVIGSDTLIEADVLIRCQRFEMGPLGEIGARAKIICGTFLAGAAVGIRFDTVFVGSGTGRTCSVGDNTFVAYECYVNLDRDVTLGRHVCLAPGSRLYTHRKWLSPLDGYSTGFAPIVIGDDVHLGSGVVVLPGVTIGERVTVMANSVVAANVAPERLIGGIPAVKVASGQSYRRVLTPEQKAALVRRNLAEAAETLALAGVEVIDPRQAGEGFAMGLAFQGRRAEVRFDPANPERPAPGERAILLTLDPTLLTEAGERVTVIDLTGHRVRGARDAVSDLFRQHMANLGMELANKTWRAHRPGPFSPDSYALETPETL